MFCFCLNHVDWLAYLVTISACRLDNSANINFKLVCAHGAAHGSQLAGANYASSTNATNIISPFSIRRLDVISHFIFEISCFSILTLPSVRVGAVSQCTSAQLVSLLYCSISYRELRGISVAICRKLMRNCFLFASFIVTSLIHSVFYFLKI